jgi:hypothetical protein
VPTGQRWLNAPIGTNWFFPPMDQQPVN